jgi:hypothetical protein
MKVQFIFILLFALPVLGCSRRHLFTADLGDHLYVEYFNVNPAGVNEAYVTDSVNFRVFIGQYDAEHERVGCINKGDTLICHKSKPGEGGGRI